MLWRLVAAACGASHAMTDLDIRSVWVRRPLPENEARMFMEIVGVHVDCCIQPSGSSFWAIRAGEGHVLGKDGKWVFEPQPSNRDEEFYRTYRWDTLDDAVTFARSTPDRVTP